MFLFCFNLWVGGRGVGSNQQRVREREPQDWLRLFLSVLIFTVCTKRLGNGPRTWDLGELGVGVCVPFPSFSLDTPSPLQSVSSLPPSLPPSCLLFLDNK